MDFVSLIIPIHNENNNISFCMESLMKQTIPFRQLQIVLVDDGSDDLSADYCKRYTQRYDNITYLYQENRGVSAARNTGIRHATGKYIFYLDADDQLAPNTIKDVTEFFDSVYDETDLVTYPIETVYHGKVLPPHFRYQFLKESGVYDLCENAYIGQTTMNIVVKNLFENNTFFDEEQTYSEDQKYCCDVLSEKLKMGYCSSGKYIYYRSDASASGRLAGSCFIFEQCMTFFEELFARFPDHVPLAFQGLYVNDFYWKLETNIMFPYHYEQDDFERAAERIDALLERCDTEVILQHPHIDFFEKYYILQRCGKDRLIPKADKEGFSLYQGDILILKENSMEMVITKVSVEDSEVEISGFLKTVFFQFYSEKPTLCAVENDGWITRKIPVFHSAHDYYLSHEQTQNFWAMKYRCDISEVRNMYFEVEVCGRLFPVHYYFMPLIPFSHTLKKYSYCKDSSGIRIDSENRFHFFRVEHVQKKRIWLYYDCSGVSLDNGLLQFEYDCKKKDGIDRYYVISDERQKHYLSSLNRAVLFGSRKHRKLFLQAEKIITAYIEENNILPFASNEYDRYADKFQFETVYLQHGVLHIKMPWKYNAERLIADRIVVSTEQEAELWRENGYEDTQLWKCAMPRYEMLEKTMHKKHKILFALTWRSYLVGKNSGHKWELLDNKFLASSYYKQIQEFLGMDQLHDILNLYEYELDIKIHPIFNEYRKYFSSSSEHIRFVNEVQDEGEYALVITDFSSYIYDFLYLQIPVLLFIPDYIEFKAGMNAYRLLDASELYDSQASKDAGELLKQIEEYLIHGRYVDFDVDFYECKDSRETIYQNNMNF